MNLSITRYIVVLAVIIPLFFLLGCDDLFGTKSDTVTDEIFDAGEIEPGLVSEVEYVPLFPFFSQGANGAVLDAPQDIYVGFDEFLYVADATGLHVLDVAGRPALFIDIPGGATSVVQDRRLQVYVTARRDTFLNGRNWNLPVLLHYSGLSTNTPELKKVIWHPFDDDSRKFNRPDPIPTDEEVEFTGAAALFNGFLYVTRRGPINDRTSIILPHNTVLGFNTDGINVGAIVALNPNQPSLRSAIRPADVLTFVQPPQRSFFPLERHFMIAQGRPTTGERLLYQVLSIRVIETSDGLDYRPDTDMLQIAGNPDRGDGYLYDEFKFNEPTDLGFAADGSNYIFVLDGGADSLYAFTSRGIEGVAPPPGANRTKPVVVSFGGSGDGALQFSNPQGVGYFDRIVYVADTGNNRISRFRLNTDFE